MTKFEIENEIRRSLSVELCEQILLDDSVSREVQVKASKPLFCIDEFERILVDCPNEKLREVLEDGISKAYETLVDLAIEELRKQGKIDLALDEWRKHVEL